MKQIFLWILILAGSIEAMAEDVTILAVWAKDGTKVCYALSDNPKITFTADNLVITSAGAEVSYPLSSMARFTYESAAGLETIVGDGTPARPFEFDGTTLLFPTTTVPVSVGIYAIDGRQVVSRHVGADTTLAISVADFTPGTYIVRIDGLTYKIAIQ